MTTKWLPLARQRGARARAEPRAARPRLRRPVPHPLAAARAAPARAWPSSRSCASGALRARSASATTASTGSRALLAARRRPPAVNQVHFSPFHYRRRLLELLRAARRRARGLQPARARRALDHPAVVEIARRLERTPAQVMLRWGIQRGAVVIPKSATATASVENARDLRLRARDEEMRALDAPRPHRRHRRRTVVRRSQGARSSVPWRVNGRTRGGLDARTTFTGQTLVEALRSGELDQPSGVVLIGMVKESEQQDHVAFARGGCDTWIDLPTSLIEQAEHVGAGPATIIRIRSSGSR